MTQKLRLLRLQNLRYQIAKIFIHYGFNSSKDFFKTTHNRHLFKQSTSVFSYFIAKGSLLYNIDKFLNFARSNCDVIKIKKGSENNFEILLKYCLEDPQFQKAIDYYINFIKKQKKKNNSLRMTCISIKNKIDF